MKTKFFAHETHEINEKKYITKTIFVSCVSQGNPKKNL
jgi:hypothetical protein